VQVFSKFLAAGVILASPASYAAEVEIEGLTIAGDCFSGDDLAAGTLKFLVHYDNSKAGEPTRFKLEILGPNDRVVNAQVMVPSIFPIYKDGILDLSQFLLKGTLSGGADLPAREVCHNGKAATKADFRAVLHPL
jgi:hypothetical protein